jgi:hypothetical protein
VTAHAIRASGWGRGLPIVFVEGDSDLLEDARMANVRQAVPGALVCTPTRLRATLESALTWGREQQAERLAQKATG